MSATKDKPRRGRPKTFDRERVIGVAMEAYWREGVEEISLNELCRRAAVSKPGVYREFGGEDGLMEAALLRYAETVLDTLIAQIADSPRPFPEVLAGVLEFITDADRPIPPGCLLVRLRGAGPRLGPKTRARVEALRQSALSTYTLWIDQARSRGELASEVPTPVAAAFLDTQISTLLVRMAEGADPGSLRAQARLAFAGLTGWSLVDPTGPPV